MSGHQCPESDFFASFLTIIINESLFLFCVPTYNFVIENLFQLTLSDQSLRDRIMVWVVVNLSTFYGSPFDNTEELKWNKTR